MADILIRMEMPRNCFECPLFTNCDACEGHECGCGLLGGIGYEEDISEDRRRDDCPLVELPEHGDLIDRVAFRAEMDNHYPFGRGTQRRHGEADAAKSTIINMLATAPVVVQASKEALE